MKLSNRTFNLKWQKASSKYIVKCIAFKRVVTEVVHFQLKAGTCFSGQHVTDVTVSLTLSDITFVFPALHLQT